VPTDPASRGGHSPPSRSDSNSELSLCRRVARPCASHRSGRAATRFDTVRIQAGNATLRILAFCNAVLKVKLDRNKTRRTAITWPAFGRNQRDGTTRFAAGDIFQTDSSYAQTESSARARQKGAALPPSPSIAPASVRHAKAKAERASRICCGKATGVAGTGRLAGGGIDLKNLRDIRQSSKELSNLHQPAESRHEIVFSPVTLRKSRSAFTVLIGFGFAARCVGWPTPRG